MTPSVLIACCGNPDRGDDALGCRVAARLREMDLPGVAVVELGMRPAALLHHLPGPARLLVVDAIRAPAPAGTLVDRGWPQDVPPELSTDDPLSSHGLDVLSQLQLARAVGVAPEEVRILGLVLGTTEVGAAPSDRGEASLDRLLARIRELAKPPEVESHA